jgi:hypothetical protein
MARLDEVDSPSNFGGLTNEQRSQAGWIGALKCETFEKCSILFKSKEGENFNHRNTLSILRIKI